DLPPSLEFIAAGNNQLEELPELQNLPFLTAIYADNNLLKTLPDLPPSLEALNVRDNYLTDLPELPQ
ncbi:hypothetical protein GWK83_20840, partial [Yersinia pestis]|nr:hypothetical protein [Yersinia pestis]